MNHYGTKSSEEAKAHIQALLNTGMTVADVAKVMQIQEATVRAIIGKERDES